MGKELVYKYTPLLLMCIAIIFQYNLFVTPQMLEHTHREILSEVAQVYITKSEFGNMKEQIGDINQKLDKIYDTLINERSTDGFNRNWIWCSCFVRSYE